jgi:hypothetical protein
MGENADRGVVNVGRGTEQNPADATLRLLREAERDLSLSKSLARMLGSERPSGSSAFRLSATPAWMSLTGSCFCSESAPGRLGAYRSSTATMTSCCVFHRSGSTVTERGSLWICPESYNRRRARLCNQVKVKQPSVGVIGQVFDSCSHRLDCGSRIQSRHDAREIPASPRSRCCFLDAGGRGAWVEDRLTKAHQSCSLREIS